MTSTLYSYVPFVIHSLRLGRSLEYLVLCSEDLNEIIDHMIDSGLAYLEIGYDDMGTPLATVKLTELGETVKI